MKPYIVALDQGTTSSRAILYDASGAEVRSESRPLPVKFPRDGWVEQDPREIWQTSLSCLKAVGAGIDSREIACLGITNQRETLIVWDRTTGEPLGPAVVWQCRRSADICRRLRSAGLEEMIRKTTGLLLDPYFSASKALWLIENTPGLAAKVSSGDAVFGTVDSWLLYQLTEKKVIATEPSNASRTMLYSLEKKQWDPALLSLFSLRERNLPALFPSQGEFGKTRVFGEAVPITAVLGDQQASLFGHGCFEKDSAKVTFGTGAFLLLNTKEEAVFSTAGLLTTVFYAEKLERPYYALEGSVFVAGSLIQWLRDKLGILRDTAECEERALRVKDSGGVVVVPAFVGLGAPHWDDRARGSIFGLTRETSADHIIRAALESVAHQVADLIERKEFQGMLSLRIDGGMTRNKFFCQVLADICQMPVETPSRQEMTAHGVALLAGLGAGLWKDLPQEESGWATFLPAAADVLRREQWKKGVARVKNWLPE